MTSEGQVVVVTLTASSFADSFPSLVATTRRCRWAPARRLKAEVDVKRLFGMRAPPFALPSDKRILFSNLSFANIYISIDDLINISSDFETTMTSRTM
jgi:hypothetical protein